MDNKAAEAYLMIATAKAEGKAEGKTEGKAEGKDPRLILITFNT
jgi:hypothetical protein